MLNLYKVTAQGSHRDVDFFIRATSDAQAEKIVRDSTLRIGEVQAVYAVPVQELAS